MIKQKKLKKLNNSEIASFCNQLSLLLPAGITPYESINLMFQDTVSSDGKELLKKIEECLKDGLCFHEALEQTEVFPEYVVSMILLGEESGNLDIIMKKLADYYEQQCAISESIKNAISYPLIMVCLMLIILVVLLTKILPIFNQVFIQLGSELTGVSKQLMNLGQTIQSVSGIFIVIFILIAVGTIFIIKNDKCNKKFTHILHTHKLTRTFFLDVSYNKFASALSLITAGGLDIYKGLELAGNLLNNEIMADKISICKQSLMNGDYMHEAMKAADMFQVQHQRMLQIGYRTGTTEAVLNKVSKHYEEAVLSKLHKILSAIEPTLVIVFSLMVGLILLSVIMPLIGIMSSIG